MPKLVNYAARFEFLRRGAFAVVRDVGPHALSRYTIADALGTSPNTVRRLIRPDTELRTLAADEVDRRRRHGRWGRPAELEGRALALLLLRRLLPDEDARIAEELVWWRLELAAARPDLAGDDAPGALQQEFAVAEDAWSADPAPTAPGTEATVEHEDPLAEQRADHDLRMRDGVTTALAKIGVDDETETRRTRALVEGLSVSVCLGRVTPAQAVEALDHHLSGLAPASGACGAAG